MSKARNPVLLIVMKYKFFILVPVVLGIVGWILVLVMTENKSIAPFVYATY